MSKAGIWLLPVITLAVSLTRLVLLTAQHLPQPTANETIER
jgi:hypothetical protein